MTDNWVGWALAAASVLALLVFVWHGLQRWSDIMRRHRDNEDRARRGEPLDASPKKAKAKKLEAMAWFAVATDDVRGAARALQLRTATPVEAGDGPARAAEGVFVFAVEGFVCAVGEDAWQRGDFAVIEAALERLSREYGDATWFCVDARSSRFGWAAARGGALHRAWCGDGDEDRVLWQFGDPTVAESELGFFVDDPRDATDDEHKWWPVAADVRALARRWSKDPAASLAAAQGLAGRC